MTRVTCFLSVALFTVSACNAKPNTTRTTSDALPPGVMIDQWEAKRDRHGDLIVNARIHNASPRVLTLVLLNIDYSDCQLTSARLVDFDGVAAKPGGNEGLTCEVIGHDLWSFLPSGYADTLNIPPGEARDVTAIGLKAPSAKGDNHGLFWNYRPMLVTDEPVK